MKHKISALPFATLALVPATAVFAQVASNPTGKPGNQSGTVMPHGGTMRPGQKGPAVNSSGLNQAPTLPKPAWQQFKLNPKTTMYLDFTESNPDMIIAIFSRTSGITILKDPTFKTPLTVISAKKVGLSEAFEIFNAVLNLNGYELQKQGNLMFVARKQPPQQVQVVQPPQVQPVPIIKTYTLKNANAAQIARVINEVFAATPSAAGGNPVAGGMIINGVPMGGAPGAAPASGGRPNGVKATSEDYSNSVIVSALPKDHTDIAALIKDLDATASTPLESELFRLKYVPSDQVISAIEDVLTANTPTGRAANKNGNQNRNYYDFGFFGGGNQRTAGGQSATAIKQTNSVIVNATHENMILVKKLLENLDQPSAFVGTSFVVRLENAKASDVADLLNKVLTQKSNPNDNNGFIFFSSDFTNPNSKKNSLTTDFDENGQIINVRDVVGKVNIVADPNTNSLLIVTQPSNMKVINDMIAKIDQVAEQVMIETIIVEANLDRTNKLGVEWNFLSKNFFNTPGLVGSGTTNFGIQNSTTAAEGLTYALTTDAYKAFINAVQTDTKFKVLDTPRIFTSNNVKAEINVSQKVPYVTSQTVNSLGNLVSNYQFEPVGVVLTVTPRITSNGQVTMEVIQSADDLQGFTSFNAPIINNRRASTTVSVNDGSTIVLGGIIRHTLTQTNKKVPFFGDIPFLGELFRSSSKQAGQTELMVFLTPHIVRTKKDADRLSKSETSRLSKSSQEDLKKIIPPKP